MGQINNKKSNKKKKNNREVTKGKDILLNYERFFFPQRIIGFEFLTFCARSVFNH